MEETLRVRIKTPSRLCEDHILEGIQLDWTIKELKRHLSLVYPTKPHEQDQRLIYAGKLLTNQLVLSDVFGKVEEMPTVHMVCSYRGQPESCSPTQLKVNHLEQIATDPPSPVPEMTAETMDSSFPARPADGLRSRWHPGDLYSSWANTTLPGAAMVPPTFPTYSLYSHQQLLWLQQVYAQQYYMQYHAALTAASSIPAPAATINPATLPNQAPPDNLPANQNVAPDINAGAANQNLRMNAQGGAMMGEEEEDVERDWLDWVYTAARFGVFLSIIYFYSSFSRFVLVMSCLLLIYLRLAGWFPFRQRPVVQPPEVIQNQQNQIQDAGLEGDALEGRSVEEASATDVPVAPPRAPLAFTAWIFFKTFFASLIPDAPHGLVN